MRGRLDVVPGIAGHDPAGRRFVLERIEIFGLAGQEAHHRFALEQAARVAFAHELHEVRAEFDIEDRLRIGRGQRLHHRAGIDLAERRPLFADPLDIRPLLRQQRLEHADGGLAVFIVRRDGGPALGRKLGGLLRQHRRLHVVRRPQAEGVAIALRHRDRVGQGLGGEEEDFLLLGEIADGKADMREEGAGQHDHLVAGDEFVGGRHGIGGLAVVVLGNHHQLLAVDAAGGVDLLDRELPALAVGLGERRQRRVAIDLADLDLVLRDGAGRGRKARRGGHDHGKTSAQKKIARSHTSLQCCGSAKLPVHSSLLAPPRGSLQNQCLLSSVISSRLRP